MKIEINARKREAQGTGASRRLRRSGNVPGIVYGGSGEAVTIELEPQGALPAPDQREVPCFHLVAQARRQSRGRAAARVQHASLQGACAAHRLPARLQGQEDPHEGAAALRQRRGVAGREGAGRHTEPRPERTQRDLPAGRSAGLHRGRHGSSHHRSLGARQGTQAAEGRRARAAQGREPGGGDHHPAGAHHRRGNHGGRSSSGGRGTDHGAGGARQGSRRRGGAATRAESRQRRRPRRKRRSKPCPKLSAPGRSGSLSAWAIQARSTNARATTPASGWWSATPSSRAWRCARTASTRRWSAACGANGAWLVLPQGFMNASGHAVQMLAGFFKIPAAEILVVHDELDFAPGVAKMKQGGGIAGHNGLRDISHRLGTHDYWRLRLGIGHPGDKNAVADYVLQQAFGGGPRGHRRGDRRAASTSCRCASRATCRARCRSCIASRRKGRRRKSRRKRSRAQEAEAKPEAKSRSQAGSQGSNPSLNRNPSRNQNRRRKASSVPCSARRNEPALRHRRACRTWASPRCSMRSPSPASRPRTIRSAPSSRTSASSKCRTRASAGWRRSRNRRR